MRISGEVWRDNPTKKRLLFGAKWPCLKSTGEIWKLALRKEQQLSVYHCVSWRSGLQLFNTFSFHVQSGKLITWLHVLLPLQHNDNVYIKKNQPKYRILSKHVCLDQQTRGIRVRRPFICCLWARLVSGRGADCRSPLEQQPQSQPLNWLLMGRKVHQQSVNSKSISERLDFGSCGEKGGQRTDTCWAIKPCSSFYSASLVCQWC